MSSDKFRPLCKGLAFACLEVGVALLLVVMSAASVSAQTNLVISSLDFKAAVVWSNALPGHSYAVQRAAALGTWQTVPGFSNVAPTGSMVTALLPVSGPTGFYRVLDNGTCCTNSGGTNVTSAVPLGTVCGDAAGSPIAISGCGTGWFRVTIAECTTGSPTTLQATVTLTSSGTSDYDLYLYNTNFVQVASSSQNPATSCVERPDVSNDQTFSIIIEVRPANFFNCDTWTLDIRRSSNATGCATL